MTTPDNPRWKQDVLRDTDFSKLPPEGSLLTRIVAKPESPPVRLRLSEFVRKTPDGVPKAPQEELPLAEYADLRLALLPYEDHLNQAAKRLAEKSLRPENAKKSLIGTTFSFYIPNEDGISTKATFKASRIGPTWRCKKYSIGDRRISLDNNGKITAIEAGTGRTTNKVVIKSADPKNMGVYMDIELGRRQNLKATCGDLTTLAQAMVNRTIDYASPDLRLETSKFTSPFDVYVQGDDESYMGFRRV